MGPLIIAALLGLACALLVLQPLFGLDRTGRDDGQAQPPVALAEVAERERLAKQALLEVDFDHRLGNLGDADYTALKARYERRALAALKARFDRERSLDEVIDRQLEGLRRQNAQGKRVGKGKRPARTDDNPASEAALDGEGAIVVGDNLAEVASSAPVTAAAATSKASVTATNIRAKVGANGHATHVTHSATTTTRDRSPRRRKGV